MPWIPPEVPYIDDRVPEETGPREEMSDADLIETTVLIERSADLMRIDPGGGLRIACARELDRHGIGEELCLHSFGWSWIQIWDLERGAGLGPAVSATMADLTEHVDVDLSKALRSRPQWYDGPDFNVLLCSSFATLDGPALAPPRDDGEAHWRAVPLDPAADEDDDCVTCWDRRFCGDESAVVQGDSCFVIAAIGGEPSPELRRLAELSGGAVVAVRDEDDAKHFARTCRERYEAVLDVLARRLAEHDQWVEENRERFERFARFAELEQELRATQAGAEEGVEPKPDEDLELDANSDSDSDPELLASIEAALAAMPEPVPADFVKTHVFIERSTAARAGDPSGTTRLACVDAIDQRGIDHAVDICAYGWGLICEAGLTYAHSLPGPAREAMREFTDHTRVDLPRAFRETEFLSGPNLIIVIGSALAEVPEDLQLGVDTDWGADEAGHGARYGDVVVLGVLGAEPSPEVAARCSATGGVALAIRGDQDIERFAAHCATAHRELLDVVEADCASGVLDLHEVYGYFYE